MDGRSPGLYAPGNVVDPTAELAAVGSSEATRSRGLPGGIVLLGAVLLGIEIRALPVLRADFPLNDGGLLAVMIRDLQHNDYLLPRFTSYNEGALPFFHPPFALYGAALLTGYGPLDVTAALRLLPLLFTVLTLPAFWFLAREFLPGSRAGLTAAFLAFAVLPASYQHLIMGGGVTRALGMVLALLALRQAIPMFLERDTRQAMLVLPLTGLVLLCDLNATWFLGLSLAIFLLALGRNESGFWHFVLVVVGAAVMSAPWWADVLITHGPGPLLAPARGAFVFSALRPSQPFNALPAAAALLGLGLCLILTLTDDRRGLIVAWLLAIMLLDTQEIALHSIPAVCLGLGLVIDNQVNQVLPRLGLRSAAPPDVAPAPSDLLDAGPLHRMAIDLAVLVVIVGFSARVYALPWRTEQESLQPVSAVERAALRAAPESIPAGAMVLVISGDSARTDRTGEWFPALASRTNLVSPQALPWPPGGMFASRVQAHARAQACADQDAACLERWERDGQASFTHVYIARRPNAACCERLRASLRANDRYVVVYDGPGATIFARVRER